MEKVYVFGHKKPDTDSVCAAISLAYLRKQMGMNAVPAVLGSINRETEYVLNYFDVDVPKYLNHVQLQIKDVNYHKGYMIHENASILNCYHYMMDHGITGIPLVSEKNKLTGLVTEKMLVKELVGGNFTHLYTTYDNIKETLEAEEVLKFDTEITGDIAVASYRSTTFLNQIFLKPDSILIVGDRHSIIEYAVQSKIKLLIVVGSGEIKDAHLQIAKENHVNIIRTPLDTFHTAKLIGLSNYVKNITYKNTPVCFEETDLYNDFLEKSKHLRHNNYPVIDKNGTCLGLIRVTDITAKHRKKVILVDHNEKEQSVNGLEEAEILEIVDHHKIGDLTTAAPINFRNMAVGSTNTILYFLYQENKVEIPTSIAGLMMSGILSDTLNLTSPTTTTFDRMAISTLEKIACVPHEAYAMDMLKAGTSLEGKTIEEVISTDLKVFPISSRDIAISQVLTFDVSEIIEKDHSYLQTLKEMMLKNHYDGMVLAVTDILKQGSYIFYTDSMRDILMDAFALTDIKEGFFLEGCVSRKKQIVPSIVDAMER